MLQHATPPSAGDIWQAADLCSASAARQHSETPTWENIWVLTEMRPWEQKASRRPSRRLTGSELKSSPNTRALRAE